MSSSRRNGSMSRAVEAAAKNKLHMDRNPQHSRITDPSNPAGRRKEIDNVMKRARQGSPGTWDRKLLEVEEKDPNRWRHSGYKQLYLESSRSPSSRRSRSPVARRSRSPVVRRSRSTVARRSRSPIARRSRSPVARRSRSPIARRSRSPIGRARSPVARTMARRSRSPVGLGKKSRSPLARRLRSPRKSPQRSLRRSPRPVVRRRSSSRSPRRARSPRRVAARQRPPSPPEPRASSSGSSGSSCSDESCSVCSGGKNKRPPAPPPKAKKRPSPPPPRPRAAPAPVPRPVKPLPATGTVVQPTRELLKARDNTKRSREEKVLEWQRGQLAACRSAPAAPAVPAVPRIKREGEKRGVDPACVAAALNDSRDSDSESVSDDPPPQRISLSERFGKMAQWSADRSARNMNMRITRRAAGLTVLIQDDEEPEPGEDLEPAPVGSYPEELLAVAPGGTVSWDDVTVRYDYYKKRGYLRGLTLGDYVKWEEWWYKYQEWLKRERAYERWAEGDMPVRRERRRRGRRHGRRS